MLRGRRIETVRELVEDVKRRIILWLFFVFGLSYLLSLTRDSLWFNLPVSVLILAAVGYFSYDLEVHKRVDAWHTHSHLSYLMKYQLSPNDPLLQPPPLSARWRRKIDSPAVEASLDEFSRRIVQEFVTDLWFASLSPDKDVPLQIQSLINDLFGEIGRRVKRINLISLVTRDLVDLVGNHFELFRQTKDGVKHFDALSTEAREESLKLVLRKSNKLHPALFSPDSEQVLQQLMSGVVAILLRPEDAQCSLLRGLARELLACAVLRPVMNFASPVFINKAIEQATSAPKEKPQANKLEKVPTDGSSNGKSIKGESSRQSKASEDLSRSEHSRDDARESMDHVDSYGKQDDWAQVLEAVSKRRTTTLAPENLDNLWTKGRNYKVKDSERVPAKSSKTEILSGSSRTTSDTSQKLTAEKHSLAPTSSRSPGSSVLSKPNYDLQSEFDMKLVSKDKPASNHGYKFSPGEAIYGSSPQSSEALPARHSASSRTTLDTAKDKEDKPFKESMGIELHHPQNRNAKSRLDGLQKHQKTPFSQDWSLNYWDNPQMRLSTGNAGYDQVADWLNDSDGLGGQYLNQPATCKLNCMVVGAHLEKLSSKTFAVYSIAVTDSDDNTWFVERRYRNFEQLHRNLRDLPQYNLQLPPKRILSSSLDDAFVRDRCILLDKYLKDLLSIPSIAELHEVWDFLSVTSKKYAYAKSPSVMRTIAVNVDDAVDDVFRQLKGVFGAPSSPTRESLSSMDPFKKNSSSVTSSVGHISHLEREKLDQFSDDEFVEHPDEESDSLLEGWHSDSELQVADSRNNALLQGRIIESGKDTKGVKKRIKRVGSDLLPGEALAGQVDEDLGVPPEWSPPKVTVPLLNLVDGIFQLQRRGWLRRQVFWMAKQILQLGMGDAVDDWLVTKVRWMRREDVVSSSIRLIQETLWPGGVFITKVQKDGNTSSEVVKPTRSDQSAIFESQLEASRCAHAVHEVLVEGGPAALVSLVGRKQYTKCAKDIYYFLQSTVFLKQLAYSVLETLVAATFPELTRLIIDIRKGRGQFVI
ncbi:hypothetical protein KP509_02G036500 [Ceratopteris richardii]|uniref:Uncharacterized protein n=1 Tax=Ceratopteris richardii TaxID=49495 RepID=A0A8T2VBX6_CERRI|nr:hypothetical protein KP509_02G036500 [Ceratopteris richardii]